MRTVTVLLAGLVLGLLAPAWAAAQAPRLTPASRPNLPWNWPAIELEELARARSRPQPSTPASPGQSDHSGNAGHPPQVQRHRYSQANALPPGFYPRVRVQAPTSLDWQFTVSKDSVTPVHHPSVAGYDSTKQEYQLFVPPGYTPARAYPLILFISAGDPVDWKIWEALCRRHQVIYAAPYNVGNPVPEPRRSRITLDVLDDVRRRLHIDADRTYLGGVSGGSRMAGQIIYALPELFGGYIAVCAGEDMRDEPWLRRRVQERLSVALITGVSDFNRAEMERVRAPVAAAHNIRSRLTVFPMGHTMPNSTQLEGVFQWLEAGWSQRRAVASASLAGCIPGEMVGPTPEMWSQMLLAEAQQRLQVPGTLESGVLQLVGVTMRWPGTSAAKTAKELLKQFDSSSEVSWARMYRAEQAFTAYVQAKADESFATGPLPPVYDADRRSWYYTAWMDWAKVWVLSTDPRIQKEADEHMTALAKKMK
jgi:hypothetical protein